jgi:hypothetical protein
LSAAILALATPGLFAGAYDAEQQPASAPPRLEFFAHDGDVSCAHCHASDASPGIALSSNPSTWPSTPPHAGLSLAAVRRLADFAGKSNPDSFFAATPLPEPAPPSAEETRLRSLGYISPSAPAFVRFLPADLVRWSRNAARGVNGELVLPAGRAAGEVLIPVVTDRARSVEIIVRQVAGSSASLPLTVDVSSKEAPARHLQMPAGTDKLVVTMPRGRTVVAIRNSGQHSAGISAIYINPQ